MPDYTVKADVDTMLRANDKAAVRSAIGVGATDAPTFLAQTLTGQSLTGTQATSLVDLATTWNTTGNPSLIYGRVTNTNSGATANLIDLGTFAGGSLFKVDKTGRVSVLQQTDYNVPSFGGNQYNTGVSIWSNSRLGLISLGTGVAAIQSATDVGLMLKGDYPLSWAGGLINGAATTLLYQDAFGILAQRNGTAKQALRVYNTALSGAPEWAEFDWITSGGTNTLRIGTNLSGTGAARPIEFVTGGAVRMSIGVAAGFVDANLPIGTADRFRSGAEGISVFASSGLNGGTGDFRVSLAAAIGVRVTAGLMYAFNSQTTMFSGGLDTALGRNAAGVVEINNATAGVFRDLRCRSVIQQPPATITPASNGDFVVEATSNTSLTLKLKGTDGTVRSVALTLA